MFRRRYVTVAQFDAAILAAQKAEQKLAVRVTVLEALVAEQAEEIAALQTLIS